ncbi:MAG: sigma-70 family RNA polymerase sigma factor [Ruminococcaceae bacterium]|nr:sigma-70 family RNA polymerase sigma factor [Oscillospiraceae bacterium]
MKTEENRQETEKLIALFREGDQQAFVRLVQMYEPLVRAEVSRYANGVETFDLDDFRQVAMIALYRATLNFDLTQCEVAFGLYAKICISNALSSHLRMVRRQARWLNRFDSFEEDTGSREDLAHWIIEEEETQLLLARIRNLLSPFENRVWSLYTAGLSAKEIGRMLGKDSRSIENAVYRIRCKLRQKLAPEG